MQTEIYRITPSTGDDLADLINDGDNMLARERLNLPPIQRKAPDAKPFVFRLMTQEEHKVFKVLFPSSHRLEAYPEYVPTEALEALIEVRETCPWKLIGEPRVWAPKEYAPDPVLVQGVRTVDDKYDFENGLLLVARWGTALEDFDKLAKKAHALWKQTRLLALKKIERQVKLALEDINLTTSIDELEAPVVYHV